MNKTSRTGLVPATKQKFKILSKRKPSIEALPSKFEAVPMALSLRPFGGLFNPFARSCSVLCNHPAPTAVKDIINRMKSLAVDGKSVQKLKQEDLAHQLHETENIPEDLFRRYTDTDSRPLTPTPTVTSVHTRNSTGSFLNNRRCITPEFGKNEIIKRKKIILDLRRTHSQETLYWKPASDISHSLTEFGDGKSKSAGATEDRKNRNRCNRVVEQRSKSSVGNYADGTYGEDDKPVEIKKVQTCVNEQHFDDENERRGKKRKKPKPTTATTTFHLSEDPETQVATLGPDSLNPSTRPSLIPNSVSLLPSKEKRENEPVLLRGSFLTDEAFQVLKTELDIDAIENTFGRYLNKAMREAFKYIPEKKLKPDQAAREEMEPIKIETNSKMPRKFSKSSTRFDVPLDPKLLQEMSVLDYLSQYVWVSDQRKQLYKRTFLQYLPQQTEQELQESCEINQSEGDNVDVECPWSLKIYVERTIPMKCLPEALEYVLEFYGTEKNINEMLRLIDFEHEESRDIDFRTWCGIAAFAERLALEDSTATDSCNELEKADFYSVEQRFEIYRVPEELREVLNIIRSTHNIKN